MVKDRHTEIESYLVDVVLQMISRIIAVITRNTILVSYITRSCHICIYLADIPEIPAINHRYRIRHFILRLRGMLSEILRAKSTLYRDVSVKFRNIIYNRSIFRGKINFDVC